MKKAVLLCFVALLGGCVRPSQTIRTPSFQEEQQRIYQDKAASLCKKISEDQGRDQQWLSNCRFSGNDIKSLEAIYELGISCAGFAKEQNRSKEWYDGCINMKEGVFEEGFIAMLNSWPKDKLCYAVASNYGKPSGESAQEVAKNKNISCEKYIFDLVKENSKSTPLDVLCYSWSKRSFHPSAIKAIDFEVSRRSVDCVKVISDTKRLEAERDAMDRQALQEMSRQNNENMRHNEEMRLLRDMQYQNNLNTNKSTSTSCTRYGNTVNCSTH